MLKRQAIDVYESFLDGDSLFGWLNLEDLSKPTGEPERRYYTAYIIMDINQDDIPELDVLTSKDYYIITYKGGQPEILASYFSNPTGYHLLNNGFFLYHNSSTAYGADFYKFFKLDGDGNEVDIVTFYREYGNGEDLFDKYVFNDSECSKEDWINKTRIYICTDESGFEQIYNEATWTVYCEPR